MKILKNFRGLNKLKQMKLFYGIVLVLMIFVSACAQQAAPEAAPSAPAAAPAPAPVEDDTETEVEAPEVMETTSEDIRALEDGNFEPNALTIASGSSVTWRNARETNIVIIIFKENRAYINSQKIDPDETFEHEFTEAGEYQFWQNIAFQGDGGTITVS